MNRNNRKKGFTLAELLVAVSIIIILGAISVVGVSQYFNHLKQMEMDQTAKQIYVAAQNHLTYADTNGKFVDYQELVEKSKGKSAKNNIAELGTLITVKPSDMEQSDWDKYEGYYYYLVYNPETNSLENTILKDILPFGSIEETVRTSGSYIVEYNVKTATIYSVFYAENKLDARDETNQFLPGEHYRGDHKNRLNYTNESGKFHLGYYGGSDISLPSGKIKAPEIKVNNEDKLIVEITDNGYGNKIDKSPIQTTVTLKVQGVQSKSSKILALPVTVHGGIENIKKVDSKKDFNNWYVTKEKGKQPVYHVALDDITTENGSFSKVFGEEFIPGEDLYITAECFGTNELTSVSVSKTVSVNSLFDSVIRGSGNESKTATANISCTRHLENLDPAVSGLPQKTVKQYNKKPVGYMVTKAEQLADIDYHDFETVAKHKTDSNTTVEDYSIYYGNGSSVTNSYYSIENSKLTAYNGNKFKISNVIAKQDNAGIFRTIESPNMLISNLVVSNSQMNGKNTSGSLIGEVKNSTLTLKNVSAKGDTSKIETTAINSSAGGLIGKIYHSTIEILNVSAEGKNFAVTTTGNSTAGGLIGEISATSIMLTNASVKGEKFAVNATAENSSVGGLVGKISSTSVMVTKASVEGEKFTVTAAGENSSVGGLIGNCEDDSIAVSFSYSTALVNGTNYAGGLIGRIDKPSADIQIVSSYVGGRTIDGGKYSEADCNVTAKSAKNINAGGFVGLIDGGNRKIVISDCYSTASVKAINDSNASVNVGGFLGSANGILVEKSYSTGLVKAVTSNEEKNNTAKKGAFAGNLTNVSGTDNYVLSGINGSQMVGSDENSTVAKPGNSKEIRNDQPQCKQAHPYDKGLKPEAFPLRTVTGDTHYGDWPMYIKHDLHFKYHKNEGNSHATEEQYKIERTMSVSNDDELTQLPRTTRSGYLFNGWYPKPIDQNTSKKDLYTLSTLNSAIKQSNKDFSVYSEYEKIKYSYVKLHYKYMDGKKPVELGSQTYVQFSADESGVLKQEIKVDNDNIGKNLKFSRAQVQKESQEAVKITAQDKNKRTITIDTTGKVYKPTIDIDIIYTGTPDIKEYKVKHVFYDTDPKSDPAITDKDRVVESSQLKYSPNNQKTLMETKGLSGIVGNQTAAVPYKVEGFHVKKIENVNIKGNGTSVATIEYSRKKYTIAYDYDGGTKKENGTYPSGAYYGQTVKFSEPNDKPGYEFAGWKIQTVNGQDVEYKNGEFIMPLDNVVITAQWTPATANYKVIYMFENANDNGYSYKKKEDKIYSGRTGEKAVVDSNKKFDGFSFISAEDKVIKGDGSTVVIAKYDRIVYDIEFYRWFGSEKISNLTISAKYGANIEKLWPSRRTQDVIASDGKLYPAVFDPLFADGTPFPSRWKNKNENILSGISTMPLGGAKYSYFRFEADYRYYNIFYVESVNSDTEYIHNHYNSYKSLTPYNPLLIGKEKTNDGAHYDLDGFTYSKEKTKENFKDIEKDKDAVEIWDPVIGKNVHGWKFYYTRNSYTITFDANGGNLGSKTQLSQTYKYEANISNASAGVPTPTRTGYTFGGWSTVPEPVSDKDDFVFANKKMPSIDIILFARWIPEKHKVTLNMNYPDSSMTENPIVEYVEHNTDIEAMLSENQPVLDGYRLVGWTTDKKGETPFAYQTKITEDVKLYAQWIKETKFIDTKIRYVVVDDNGNEEEIAESVHVQVPEETDYSGYIKNIFGYKLLEKDWMEVEGNIVTFKYKPINVNWNYTIHYKLKNGSEVLTRTVPATYNYQCVQFSLPKEGEYTEKDYQLAYYDKDGHKQKELQSASIFNRDVTFIIEKIDRTFDKK